MNNNKNQSNANKKKVKKKIIISIPPDEQANINSQSGLSQINIYEGIDDAKHIP